ncbi:RNA polymerase sigma-70 factor, ECF subfamily [Mariniphaga anaerophila]|uniref:RNA polymerase sigma-70 factor, ECF subfamily n=1 Tax=Mariniphaga anaerophila TaxID=1484053 RepID=A0A1M5FJD7_9BACT|nr:RNA polymerase sigma-70 factor [Mariniphaga anaerophila]SHF91633.1 RNA polymerase sigma-70 factor, ECF subfamily [Mariniphaga anaerophila]
MKINSIERETSGRLHNTFDLLYKKYYAELSYFVTSILRSGEQAEDVVQEIFLTIWLKGDMGFLKGSIKNYLYSSARNRSIDFLKHQKVREKYMNYSFEIVSNATPENWVYKGEIDDILKESLHCMSPRCREVFELSRIKGMKNQEIAEGLGLSRRTVEHHISSALKSIRNNLALYINN